MNRKEIEDRLIEIILRVSKKPDKKINEEMNIIHEYSLDSLTLINMLLEIEEAFGISFEIDNLDVSNFETLGKLTDSVIRLKNM